MRHLKLETSQNGPTLEPPTAPENMFAALLVASGKGGVGTSVVAALAALAAAERGERVLLVDATEASGSLHMLFGVRPTRSLWTLIDPDSQPNEALFTLGDGLTLVAGGTSGSADVPVTDHQRRAALSRLALVYNDFDLVVFDGGSRLDSLAAIADLVDPQMLLVTSADRLALAANYALVKAMSARNSESSISVVANRHGEKVAEEACDFLVGACDHFLGRSIAVVGVIPDDPCLQAAVGAGMSVRDALDGSPAADAMRGVLSRVNPPRPATPPTPLAFPLSSSRRWS
ncbi:MAG: P-loop NTPase [Gemmatimonadaceae bacterium]